MPSDNVRNTAVWSDNTFPINLPEIGGKRMLVVETVASKIANELQFKVKHINFDSLMSGGTNMNLFAASHPSDTQYFLSHIVRRDHPFRQAYFQSRQKLVSYIDNLGKSNVDDLEDSMNARRDEEYIGHEYIYRILHHYREPMSKLVFFLICWCDGNSGSPGEFSYEPACNLMHAWHPLMRYRTTVLNKHGVVPDAWSED